MIAMASTGTDKNIQTAEGGLSAPCSSSNSSFSGIVQKTP